MKKIAFITIFLACQLVMQSQTHTWTGNGDGYFWSDPLNWDMGTIPLQNGEGTVIIPEGVEVVSTSAITFTRGEFTGGGTLNSNGTFQALHIAETNSTKILSNFTLKNTGTLTITKAAGISNTEPFFINEGATLISQTQQGLLRLDGVDISFNTLNPGILNITSPLLKNGANAVTIDTDMYICCYDFTVAEGSLLIEPFNENTILGPTIGVEENASLIFSGANHFGASSGSIEGYNNGYLEIKNNGAAHPMVIGTLFYSVHGTLTWDDVTFTGGGTFRIQEAHLFMTGNNDITLDDIRVLVQPTTGSATLGTGNPFQIFLENGARFSNGSDAFYLDGASIVGTGTENEQFNNGGILTVMNSTIDHHFNGVVFNNNEFIQLNEGTILMDDASSFSNFFSQNPEFPEFIDYGTVQGSGTFQFPSLFTFPASNNGYFEPGPGIQRFKTTHYHQTETAKLLIDINGYTPEEEYDVIENTGEASIEGGFEVNLTFEPQLGDEFVVFTSDSNITNCTPESTTTAIYNNLNYVFDVLCHPQNVTLRVSQILSVEDFIADTRLFNLVSNPVSTEAIFNIENFSTNKDAVINIYSLSGKRIENITSIREQTIVNTENFSNGIYLVTYESHGRLTTLKMVVER
ncbi:T9SS type A sorting domain-containing protein [Dokdonia ponticola]|uniref:T9SS type A sorting domain-containing protein n=1 Tax=Dokdonia ponticola TaxID=2041041 RepID=A0ABV9HUC9_9FLAO